MGDRGTVNGLVDEHGKVPSPENFGSDGNALSLVASVTYALKRNKWPLEAVEKFRKAALSGDYDHVVWSCMTVLE